jgi:hypothetical protein
VSARENAAPPASYTDSGGDWLGTIPWPADHSDDLIVFAELAHSHAAMLRSAPSAHTSSDGQHGLLKQELAEGRGLQPA